MKNNLRSLLASLAACFGLLQVSAQYTSFYWSLNGNSNATLSNKIGTTNNVSLRFVTNNIERMKIHKSGNVGIGTSSPAQKLHVVGQGLFTSGLTVSDGSIKATSSTNYGIFGKGSPAGVYGESQNDPITGELFAIGVSGKGKTGVLGTGEVGVYGESLIDDFSVYSVGVTGNGKDVGVEGLGRGRNSYGVFALGAYGVKGRGQQIGVIGEALFEDTDVGYGVYGTGKFIGVLGISTDGDGVVGNSANGYAGAFYGKLFSSGSFEASDQNLKKNIQEFTDAISIINKLKPKSYEFKEDAQ